MEEPRNKFERLAEEAERAAGEGRSLYSRPNARSPRDRWLMYRALRPALVGALVLAALLFNYLR